MVKRQKLSQNCAVLVGVVVFWFHMVLLPTPLKAFTDTIPEVKSMLRLCARNMYSWQCDHVSQEVTNAALDAWNDWSSYPKSWPKEPEDTMSLGISEINNDIRGTAIRRWNAIRNGLEHGGPYDLPPETSLTLM